MSRQKTGAARLALPRGFRAAGVHAGIKRSGQKDMALLVSDVPAAVAGVFTTNQVRAASVKLCMKHLKGREARAIVVNSGNANACTGRRGARDARRMAALTARLLGVGERTVFVCSTGMIGMPLPMNLIEAGIGRLVKALSVHGGMAAARAIMTTDTRVKTASTVLTVGGRRARIAALCKGAGMIEPNMATMLCFILTDAAVRPGALQSALSGAVARSFNRITVDGDRSTNDTVLVLANGAAGNEALGPAHEDWKVFCEALERVTMDLALKIVADGEGASKFVTVRVRGAVSDAQADIAARAVANSLLVKTSWAGGRANWGRVMDALGYSSAKVVEERVDIEYSGVPAVRKGAPAGAPWVQLNKIVERPEFSVDIDLHLGRGQAVVYTCDCTEEYVRINM